MRVILFSEGCFGCGATYKEAYAKLEEAENGPPDCRNDDEEFLEPPKPIGMVLTDDDTASVDGYGRVITDGGAWTVSIPLEKDAPPSVNYRFNIMQRLKDEDFEKEVWEYRRRQCGNEFQEFCKDTKCAGCEFYEKRGEMPVGGQPCFSLWWEKYKKDKEEKEDSNG